MTAYTTQTLSNNDDLFTLTDNYFGALSQYDLIVFLYSRDLDDWMMYHTYDITQVRDAVCEILFKDDVTLRWNPKLDVPCPDDKYKLSQADKIVDMVFESMTSWMYDNWED